LKNLVFQGAEEIKQYRNIHSALRSVPHGDAIPASPSDWKGHSVPKEAEEGSVEGRHLLIKVAFCIVVEWIY
jgi:hypothetical protein